ncbi:MAG: response regulator [Bacteroidetes bacterium]|nr:response regulator [Bacteroidota bacterium]
MKSTVLYIDDEEENLRVFKSVYRRDFNILTALSGQEGLDILSKNECQLIITDQRMPKMTGVEFLKKVHDSTLSKQPSSIILSGFSKTADIDEAKEKYALYAFVSKPWDVHDLKQEMDKAINDAPTAA